MTAKHCAIGQGVPNMLNSVNEMTRSGPEPAALGVGSMGDRRANHEAKPLSRPQQSFGF